MKKQMKYLILVAVTLAQLGCVSIRSVSLTSIPPQRGSEIRAEAGKVIILGFNFDNDFIDQMTNDLRRQCPGGEVKGILTKDETVDYFIGLVYKYRVSATGYCVKKSGVAMLTGGGTQ